MASLNNDLLLTNAKGGMFESTSDDAWLIADCFRCGPNVQMALIARTPGSEQIWARCVNCKSPHVAIEGHVYPATLPFGIPDGVDGVELQAWTEARECLGAGANTAAVMMCRKILLHLAVAQGMPAKNGKDRAPTFAEVNNFLETEGIITKRMRSWVDLIKDVGNDGAHEITPVSREDALNVAKYTEQLLLLTYELSGPAPEVEEESAPGEAPLPI